ncbi:MAG: hypothetical protein K5765_01720 [Clostridia bacterium]|nr:hypothetical protein [Clostridia bacterium]
MQIRKNNVYFILFLVLLLIACITFFALNFNYSSLAKADEIIHITSVEDFLTYAEYINNSDYSYADKSYILDADLDLSLEDDFYGISVSDTKIFKGSFDGNGHTITLNIYSTTPNVYTGLFGYTSGAANISDLIVAGYIKGMRVGSIVGYNKGTISNCIVTASVESIDSTGGAGGITARNDGVISSCVVGNILVKGQNNLGGITANNTTGGQVLYTATRANVISQVITGTSSTKVASIVGNNDGKLQDIVGYGSVSYLPTNVDCGSGIGKISEVAKTKSSNIYIVDFASSDVIATSISKYNLLEENTITLSQNMSRALFECGYGYMYCPISLMTLSENNYLITNIVLKDIVRICIFSGGVGTEESPFTISSSNEFVLFGQNLQFGDYENKYVKLLSNVAIDNDEGYGEIDKPFKGKLNGNSKTISIVQESNKVCGIFKAVENAEIYNVKISADIVTSTTIVGSLAAIAKGDSIIVDDVNIECIINSNTYSGGLFGEIDCDICQINNVKVGGTINSASYSGGLVGFLNANDTLSLQNIQSYVTLRSSLKYELVGGIFGEVNLPTTIQTINISGLYFEGIIETKANKVGGIFGDISTSINSPVEVNISKVMSMSSISGTNYVGSIVGFNNAILTIENFAVYTDCSGSSFVSGVSGITNKDITLSNGYYIGNLTKSKGESNIGDIFVSKQASDTISVLQKNNIYYVGTFTGIGNNLNATKVTNIQLAKGDEFDNAVFSITDLNKEKGVYPYVTGISTSQTLEQRLTVNFFDGIRTIENKKYYDIGTVNALNNLITLINEYEDASNTYSEYSYYISSDISVGNIKPITKFSGELLGDFKNLSNVVITATNDEGQKDAAFILTIESGAVIDGIYFSSGTITSEYGESASLAKTVQDGAVIQNCIFSTDVYNSFDDNTKFSSGIACYNSGTIRNCVVNGNIISNENSGATSSAGITGKNTNTSLIDSVAFKGTIISNNKASGISVESNGAEFNIIQVSGYIYGENLSAGIVANTINDTINYAYIIATIKSSLNSNAFGLLGTGTINPSLIISSKYNGDLLEGASLAYSECENNGTYVVTTESILSTEAISNFSRNEMNNNRYNTMFNSYNSLYMINLVENLPSTGAIGTIISSLDDIAIYGIENGNLNEWGTEDHPYLINSAKHITMLRELINFTDYSGKYFMVTQDINMNSATGSLANRSIGVYDSNNIANSKVFKGKFYGKELVNDQVKIENITITASVINGNLYYNNVGFFAYVGEGFELKNIAFYGNVNIPSSETTSSSVGGLIGYFEAGLIQDVYVGINVSGMAMVGGIIGSFRVVSTQTTTIYIENCVYNGNIESQNDSSSVYGIIGFRSDTTIKNISITNSWYITSNLEYVTNNFGNILYVDNDGDFVNKNVVVNYNNANKYGIVISNYNNEYGYLMNSSDVVPNSFENGQVYYLKDANSTYYYARFCTQLELLDNGNAYIHNNAGNKISLDLAEPGYFYKGQTVTLTLSWLEYKYQYTTIKAELGDTTQVSILDVQERNSENDIVFTFEMLSTYKKINVLYETIKDKDDGNNILVVPVEKEYTGESLLTINLVDGTYEYSIYQQSNLVDIIKDAGTYYVLVKILDGTFVKGIYSEEIVIKPKTLSDFSFNFMYINKEYDGTNTIVIDNAGVNSFSIIGSDSLNVRAQFSFYEDSERTQQGINVSDLSVDDGYNYFVNVESIEVLNTNYYLPAEYIPYLTGPINTIKCRVSPKNIVVSISQAQEVGDKLVIYSTYERDSDVVIPGTYQINPKWVLQKLDNNYEIDEEWAALLEKTYDVGYYKIGVVANDVSYSNYVLTMASDNYYLVIEPKIVDTVYVSNANNLVYDGSEKSSIVLYFKDQGNSYSIEYKTYIKLLVGQEFEAETIYYEFSNQNTIVPTLDETASASKNYYYESLVLNAGDYLIKSANPYDETGNYEITDEVIQFTVEKAQGIQFNYDYYKQSDIETKITTSLLYDSNGFPITANDCIYIDDISNIDYGYQYRLNKISTNGADVMLVDSSYNDHVYTLAINPYKYNGVIAFKIIGTNSINYKDTQTETIYLRVNPDTLNIRLKYLEYTYGDVIDLTTFVYEKQNGEEIEEASILGLKKPKVTFSTSKYDVGSYVASFSAGSSFGYVFNCSSTITISKKAITLAVTGNINQVYGEEESTITYNIYNSMQERITQLPNGNNIVINGQFTREEGVDVGSYEINHNEIISTNNTNYDLSFEVDYKYIIQSKQIILNITNNQSKEFGGIDPDNYLLEPADGYSFSYLDTYMYFYNKGIVTIEREFGEDVGVYRYSATINNDSKNNYYVMSINITDSFRINKTVPELYVTQTGLMQYGDTIDEIKYTYSATCPGVLEFSFPAFKPQYFDYDTNSLVNTMVDGNVYTYSQNEVNVRFTPNDSNYSVVNQVINFKVEKRSISIKIYYRSSDGLADANNYTFIYSGRAHETSEFTYEVSNAVDNNYNIALSITGENKNVSNNGFTVRASLNGDDSKYICETQEAKCYILKGMITVKLEDISINVGDRLNPRINYIGFVGSETDSVITKKATISSVDTSKAGIVTIRPSGAEANNYDFTYVEGTIKIIASEIEDKNGLVYISGIDSATYNITTKEIEKDTTSFNTIENLINEANKANIIIRPVEKMLEYVKIDATGNLGSEEELTYSVVFNSNITEKDKIYARYADGSVKAVEYTVETNEDGKSVVTFDSTEVVGVALYTGKTIMEILQTYMYHLIIGGVILIALIFAITTAVLVKKDKRENTVEYAVRTRWRKK